jgi:hypothetical protein
MTIEGWLNVERDKGYLFVFFAPRGKSGFVPCATWANDDEVLRNRLDYVSVDDVDGTLKELTATGRTCRPLRVDEDMLRDLGL